MGACVCATAEKGAANTTIDKQRVFSTIPPQDWFEKHFKQSEEGRVKQGSRLHFDREVRALLAAKQLFEGTGLGQ